LFTGRRSLVYVELEEQEAPTYEARVVTLGPRMGELYPVLSGLEEGDRVVVHGAFAIDADLQIQGGESMMKLPIEPDTPPGHAGHEHHQMPGHSQ
jgi:Cu(I)/Ag(I) efflux system membrane fusion protein